MQLRKLGFFIAVAEELSIRRAAKRLGIAQSALTKQIAGLEAELGLDLLVRDRQRVVGLTPPGESLLEDARRILAGTSGRPSSKPVSLRLSMTRANGKKDGSPSSQLKSRSAHANGHDNGNANGSMKDHDPAISPAEPSHSGRMAKNQKPSSGGMSVLEEASRLREQACSLARGLGQLINGEGDKALGVFAVAAVTGASFLGGLPLIGVVYGITWVYGVADGYLTGKKKG